MEKWQEIRGLHKDYNEKLIDTSISFKLKLASQKRFEKIEKQRGEFEKTKVNLMARTTYSYTKPDALASGSYKPDANDI